MITFTFSQEKIDEVDAMARKNNLIVAAHQDILKRYASLKYVRTCT